VRYANSKHSHQGIGVEPQGSALGCETSVLIVSAEHREQIRVRDKAQLQEMVNLLQDASVLCGWGPLKT
jgi:hypothetical protein